MSDSRDLVVERSVKAPPATVFQYLTGSQDWAAWQGVEATIEAQPGGIFKMSMANGMTARGQFVEVVPNTRVVFTWGWTDYPGVPPGSTTVTIDLIESDNTTLIRLTHSGLPADEIGLHQMGWNHHVPRLVMVSEGADPGPDPGPASG